MKDFICEQRPVESWAENAPEGAKRIISKFSNQSRLSALALDGYDLGRLTPISIVDSIRFQLVEQPKSRDCSMSVESVGDAGGDAGATMEVDLKSEEFPLATLNLQKGMEIRLAFEGGATTRLDKGPYFWIWPMVTYILPGRHYKAADKTRNKMELNVRNLLIDDP